MEFHMCEAGEYEVVSCGEWCEWMRLNRAADSGYFGFLGCLRELENLDKPQLLTFFEVMDVVTETLGRLGMSHLTIKVSWNKRFTNKLGDARVIGEGGRVRFSEPLWFRATREERYDVIVHEVCHITCNLRHGQRCGHNSLWHQEMRRAGIRNAQRCHDVDRSGLTRKKARVEAKCGCSNGVTLGPIQAKKLAAGKQRYNCTRCRRPIRLV